MNTQRERDALDRYITGNYGEDQFADESDEPDGCDAECKPDMIGTVVHCDKDAGHDGAHGGDLSYDDTDIVSRVTWATPLIGPRPAPRVVGHGANTSPSLDQERATAAWNDRHYGYGRGR